MNYEQFWLGFDVGSVSLKTVLVDNTGHIHFEDYRRTHGQPFRMAATVLEEMGGRFPAEKIAGVAVTGLGGARLAEVLGGVFVNEIIALSRGLRHVAPGVRTGIDMGGQDSKMLSFDQEGNLEPARGDCALCGEEGGCGDGGQSVLKDFAMNSLCAAGTGSFLDQQATRLGVAIEEEFGRLALEADSPPRIAGRCSVFAKSDMIHLQQVATPIAEIAMGLCLALARSFKSTVGRGQVFHKPIAFVGGVASNAGMVHAFERVLGLEPGELIIPENHRVIGAMGAAYGLRDANQTTPFHGIEALQRYLHRTQSGPQETQDQLRPFLTPAGTPDMEIFSLPPDGERVDAFIGIDIGSISTNVVAVDREDRVLAKRYLWTASQPIEAVRKGLDDIRDALGDRITVRGCGTTGSGRYLIGSLIGADVIRNEITAQATAAIMLDPQVDTIFEIGGQDSKYISIDHGAVCDFEMNKACAAGTGSFLSEQAERLGVDLKTEFSPMALDAPAPVSLGDRCTVFMESDLVHHQQAGAETPDLLAGLAYSIVHNYLNRVVADRRVGERIFFQGGTAFNKAVVAAFNNVTGKEVTVPPHHEVTGAIGVAMLARRYHEMHPEHQTDFRGFDFSKLAYEIKSFVCKSCDNLCEIRRVDLEGAPPLYYGSRCEKFEVDQHVEGAEDLPDLFAEREVLLRGENRRAPANAKGRVGIPMALSFHEFLPFWRTFFEELGFEVVLSRETCKGLADEGVEVVTSETCFPVKVAHGHILDLMKKEVDFLFIPSLIDSATEESGPDDPAVFNCPLVQTLPYTSRSAIDFEKRSARTFMPALRMQWGLDHIARVLAKGRDFLGSSSREIRKALQKAEEAQQVFAEKMEARGREILQTLSPENPALVIVSRPYNGCDLGLNLDLPKKIRSLGALPIPMDMLPLSETRLAERWSKVYWRYGQRILKAGQIIRQNANLFAVYITNFSCGPDSFLLDYFRREMGSKPALLLEIDEHSADAGLITRCEAFLDTLENLDANGGRRVSEPPRYVRREFANHRRIYVPRMSPHAHALAAAFRANQIPAQVMPPSDEESVRLGLQYTSGRECYPCLLTTGDMVRQTRKADFQAEASAFFMASADGPCRFGQYNQLQREVLDRIGLEQVPILALEQGRDYDNVIGKLGTKFERLAWNGICATDVLEKLLLEKRPYETHPGETDAWFRQGLDTIAHAVEKGLSALYDALPEIARQYAAIPFTKEDRPLIGVVGEVYVRTNDFANRDLARSIEALGGEARFPTLGEWVNYTRYDRMVENKSRRRYGRMLGNALAHHVVERDEKKVYGFFDRTPDPGPESLFAMARPYLDPSFKGESILTIGKTVELIRHDGVDGIINTMPFTCMPGAICTALLKRVREDHRDIPLLNISYAGQQSTNTEARLEAFLFQAGEFGARV